MVSRCALNVCGRANKPRMTKKMKPTTKEPQYQILTDVAEQLGVASLGLMFNEAWQRDPRRALFVLSRYKFVAKMLEGTNSVLEVGCGDAFGTRIVQQSVGKICAIDFDPVFIADAVQRQAQHWPFDALVHDIVAAPMDETFDAAYSLDVLEHIDAKSENRFLENICSSLTKTGVLLIGTPSLESQQYASRQSKEGHVNCKSGNALREFLNRYFHNVFLFSMNDEVLHTGFSPMAHYLFCLCCGKR